MDFLYRRIVNRVLLRLFFSFSLSLSLFAVHIDDLDRWQEKRYYAVSVPNKFE